MSAPVFPPVDDVLPQAGRMVLLTRILRHAEDRTTCAVEISSASAFLDGQGGVPAWVALEYMAQCIAAHGGLRARAAGDPVALGFLLGSRSVALHTPAVEQQAPRKEVFWQNVVEVHAVPVPA